MVFEEIIGNIVRYGAPHGADLCIEVSVEIGREHTVMTVEDDGVAFDPCGQSAAAVPTSLAEAPDGGFGLKIARAVVSSMRYERAANHNRLVIRLRAS